MVGSLEVRVLRTVEEVEAAAAEWTALAMAARSSNPFLLPEWTLAWLEATPGVEPFVMMAWATSATADGGARLAGVWPLARRAGLRGRVLSYVEGDVFGLLAAEADLEATATALGAELARRAGEWDALVLCDHITGTPSAEALAAALVAAGLHTTRIETYGYPYVSIEGPLADYQKRVGKKVVSEVKRRRRQLEALAPVRLERATSAEAARAHFPALVELHRRRWHGKSDTSGFASEARIAGIQRAAERLGATSRLALDLLFVDGLLIAYCIGMRLGGRLVYYSPGFEPAYAPFSVSKVLLLQQLEWAFEAGPGEFDFSRGDEPYKLVWATASRRGEAVVARHAGARSRLAAGLAASEIRARMAARQNEAIMRLKRDTLGRLRSHLDPAAWRARAEDARATLARSAGDRGTAGTVRRLVERAAEPVHVHSVGRLYELPLPLAEPPPPPAVAPAGGGLDVGLLRPSEFDQLVRAGRHDLAELVRRAYAGHRCFVARDGGEIAAYAFALSGRPTTVPEIGRELELEPTDVYIYDCYTYASFRGRGLYPLLLRHAIASATQAGAKRAYIAVRDDNRASIAGIEKVGFKLAVRAERTEWFGRGHTRELPVP